MKIPAETVATMAAAITPLDTPYWRERYATGQYPRSEATKDVNKRYRWDLLHASGVDVCALYDAHDCNDSHIDTALRKIVAPLRPMMVEGGAR